MAHRHSVYDTDLHFIIDPISRKITSESGKVSLMQNDHNSERFTFQIPRYVEGHDMSICNVAQVHYENIDSTNKRNKSADIYEVVDLQLAPDDNQVVIGSWLVSQNATKYGGSLNFIFRFACISEEDQTIEYQWFSDIYKVIQINQGIYNVDVVTEEGRSDILEAWKLEITTESANVTKEITDEALEEMQTIKDSGIAAMNGIRDASANLLRETDLIVGALEDQVIGTEFMINWETGNLEYESPDYTFEVNEQTGNLEYSRTMTEGNVVQRTIDACTSNKADALTRTMDGESLIFEDSTNAPLAGLRVFGKTEQVHTTGAQLFDANLLSLNTNKTLDITDDGYSITAIGGPGYQYAFSRANLDVTPFLGKTVFVIVDSLTATYPAATSGTRVQCCVTRGDGAMEYKSVTLGNTRAYFEVPEDSTLLTVGIYTNNMGAALETDNTVVVKGLRLALTENAPWEPFTGGKASPSPEYPQELVSVENPVVYTRGKNLIPNLVECTRHGITVTANADGTSTINGTATEAFGLKSSTVYIPDGTYTLSCNHVLSTGMWLSITNSMLMVFPSEQKKSYALEGGDHYLYLFINSGTTFNNFILKPQLEIGNVDTEYEPYRVDRNLPINYTLPAVQVTDASLATYTDQNGVMWCADEVDFERGVYVKRIGKHYLSSVRFGETSDISGRFVTNLNMRKIYSRGTVTDISNFAIWRTWGEPLSGKDVFCVNEDLLYFSPHNTMTADEVNALFGDMITSDNPPYFISILTTSIETPLSNSELNDFRNLYSNYPTTTVLNDSGAHMEVTCYADTKNYIAVEHAKMMAEMKALISS